MAGSTGPDPRTLLLRKFSKWTRIELSKRTLILDLCGTLVSENTTHGFLCSLPVSGLRRAVLNAALSRMGGAVCNRVGIDARLALLVPALKGLQRDFLYEHGVAYAKECLRRGSNPMVVSAIGAARDAGAKVILATASLDPIASAITRVLELDGVVSAELAYDDDTGRCLGRLAHDTTRTSCQCLTTRMTTKNLTMGFSMSALWLSPISCAPPLRRVLGTDVSTSRLLQSAQREIG